MTDDPRVLRFRRDQEPPSERAAWAARPEGASADGPAPPAEPGAATSGATTPSGGFATIGAGDVETPTLLRRRRPRAEPTPSVLPFRRSRERRIRRLRQSPLIRILGPLMVALAIVSAPVAVVLWFAHSPLFALQTVEISLDEAGRVDPLWVERALRPFDGENLWLVPLDEMQLSLQRHPWVADVGLRKRPPNGLVVRIVERREVALAHGDRGLAFVDAEGRQIAPLAGAWFRPGIDLPIISGGSGTEAGMAAAVAFLREIESVEPPWGRGLSEIEILSDTDYRVHTVDLPFPLLVRAGTVENKNRRLEQLLPRIVERFDAIEAVDLRFARRIIIEPAAREDSRRTARAT